MARTATVMNQSCDSMRAVAEGFIGVSKLLSSVRCNLVTGDNGETLA